MNNNGLLERRRLRVLAHFGLDAILFFAAFSVGTFLRLGTEGWGEKFWLYLPGIVAGAFIFSCATYISGLYSGHHGRHRLWHALRLAVSLLVATVSMVGVFYLFASTPVGRGVLLISTLLAYCASLFHHVSFIRPKQAVRERVAIIIAGRADELQAANLVRHWSRQVEFMGVIHYDGYRPQGPLTTLGAVGAIDAIIRREKIARLLCSDDTMNDPAMCRHLCLARYSGVAVTPLVTLCEELFECVPLELIRPEWLLHASSNPDFFYISKIKRAFDVVISLGLLLVTFPLLLAAMLAVRMTSPGPIFYRQARLGRFGREFRVTKLRTMQVDAEADGPAWASPGDSRQTPIGGFLRKYRIDEMPQLLNIFRGEMSFVGPRPERPEFAAPLTASIPFYSERLMIHPGLTGWAQVNYPYGASEADTRRKLEFDLYYMKHMSLFLDLFILLDTVRTVLLGGARELPGPGRLAVETAEGASEECHAQVGREPSYAK